MKITDKYVDKKFRSFIDDCCTYSSFESASYMRNMIVEQGHIVQDKKFWRFVEKFRKKWRVYPDWLGENYSYPKLLSDEGNQKVITNWLNGLDYWSVDTKDKTLSSNLLLNLRKTVAGGTSITNLLPSIIKLIELPHLDKILGLPELDAIEFANENGIEYFPNQIFFHSMLLTDTYFPITSTYTLEDNIYGRKCRLVVEGNKNFDIDTSEIKEQYLNDWLYNFGLPKKVSIQIYKEASPEFIKNFYTINERLIDGLLKLTSIKKPTTRSRKSNNYNDARANIFLRDLLCLKHYLNGEVKSKNIAKLVNDEITQKAKGYRLSTKLDEPVESYIGYDEVNNALNSIRPAFNLLISTHSN